MPVIPVDQRSISVCVGARGDPVFDSHEPKALASGFWDSHGWAWNGPQAEGSRVGETQRLP
jgi:hypothetical protein